MEVVDEETCDFVLFPSIGGGQTTSEADDEKYNDVVGVDEDDVDEVSTEGGTIGKVSEILD